MPLNREQARDEIASMLKEAADSLGQDGLLVLWPDSNKDTPTTKTPWARVDIVHQTTSQRALAGADSQRRYTSIGLVTVQIFTPAGDGLKLSDEYSSSLAQAYRGKTSPNGVWFRDVTCQEIGLSGVWYQVNLVATFEYGEIA